jgi:hypothetical protein
MPAVSEIYLILIVSASQAAPGVLPQIVRTEAAAQCSRLLAEAIAGIKGVYIGNATGPHRNVQTSTEDGWTVVKTGLGREIGRARCTG